LTGPKYVKLTTSPDEIQSSAFPTHVERFYQCLALYSVLSNCFLTSGILLHSRDQLVGMRVLYLANAILTCFCQFVQYTRPHSKNPTMNRAAIRYNPNRAYLQNCPPIDRPVPNRGRQDKCRREVPWHSTRSS